MSVGRFITLEGTEGAGKSSLSARLRQHLEQLANLAKLPELRREVAELKRRVAELAR